MASLFPYAREAIENTHKIAMRCHVDIEFGHYKLPEFPVPEGYDSWEYLQKLVWDGFYERYPQADEKLKERVSYELNTIKTMGFVDYFLIVWDFIHYAKEHDIMVGPGRGSAAGSIVSYCLDITTLDPIRYNLLFERFLNPNRVTMPDIDVDFCFERRQEVTRPGQCVPFWAVCGSMPLHWCAAARWPTILPMAPAGRCAALPGRTPICSPACRTQRAWASLCR